MRLTGGHKIEISGMIQNPFYHTQIPDLLTIKFLL